ncbi:unnamed protein product [Amoebophrya sp. A120]|nr:unnamed protein product [Amoebophrya sp. A120]|eukprot:GSA120T00017426001.1
MMAPMGSGAGAPNPAGLLLSHAGMALGATSSGPSKPPTGAKIMKPLQLWNILQLPPGTSATKYFLVDFRRSRKSFDAGHIKGFRWVGYPETNKGEAPLASGAKSGDDLQVHLVLDDVLAAFEAEAGSSGADRATKVKRRALVYVCDNVVALQTRFNFDEVYQISFEDCVREFPLLLRRTTDSIPGEREPEHACEARTKSLRLPIAFSNHFFCAGSGFFASDNVDLVAPEEAAVQENLMEQQLPPVLEAAVARHEVSSGSVDATSMPNRARTSIENLCDVVEAMNITEVLLVVSSVAAECAHVCRRQKALVDLLLDAKHALQLRDAKKFLSTTALPLPQSVEYLLEKVPKAEQHADRLLVLSAEDSSAAAAVTGYYLEQKRTWSLNIALAFVMKKIPSFQVHSAHFAYLSTLPSPTAAAYTNAVRTATNSATNNLTRNLLRDAALTTDAGDLTSMHSSEEQEQEDQGVQIEVIEE